MSDSNPLPVRRIGTVRKTGTSSGLTTAATAYTAGDVLDAEIGLTNAARASGGFGSIRGITLLDKGDVLGPVDIVISRDTMTVAANNAAWAPSDADMAKVIDILTLGSYLDVGGARFFSLSGLDIAYDCTATTLYYHLVTRTGNAVFAATTDIVVNFYLELE